MLKTKFIISLFTIFLILGYNLNVSAFVDQINCQSLENDLEKDLNILYGQHIFTIYAIETVSCFNLYHVIPLIYEDQVPLFLRLGEETTANIVSYKIEDDTNEPNKIINLTIGQMNKGHKAKIHIEYWVLIRNKDFKDLPEYSDMPKKEDLPLDTKIFLDSTEPVQSENIFIKIKAKKLLRDADNNLIKYSENVVKFSHLNRRIRSPLGFELGFLLISSSLPNILYRLNPEKYSYLDKLLFNLYFISQDIELENLNIVIRQGMLNDALSAYFFGGHCVGASNLVAALLRANEVPTKQLIVNSDKKSKTTAAVIHYICEYYCPDYGWVRTDSRFFNYIVPISYNESIVLKVIYPEEEDLAGSGMKGKGGMVPFYWFSDDNMSIGGIIERCWNEKIITVNKNISNNVLELTRDIWELFSNYLGKDLGYEKNKNFENATEFLQEAIKFFKESDFDGFFSNLNSTYNELLKI
jgi:hypothetical protein